MARVPNGPVPRPLYAKQRNAATLGDVAARAGVSISAVSRVLSNAPSARVSEATRQRIGH
jgi:LacI family transcriptional regulator